MRAEKRGVGARKIEIAERTGEERSESETESKIDLHALVLIVGIQDVTALHCALNITVSLCEDLIPYV